MVAAVVAPVDVVVLAAVDDEATVDDLATVAAVAAAAWSIKISSCGCSCGCCNSDCFG